MSAFKHYLLFCFGLILVLGAHFTWAYSDERCNSRDLCLGTSSKKCGKLVDRVEYSVEVRNTITNDTAIFPFCIGVDKFSRVTLRGSYNWMTSSGRDIKDARITLRVGNVRSREKAYTSGDRFASVLTSILQFGAYGLESGVIKGITWDDTCSNNRCIFDYGDNCINGADCGTNFGTLTPIQRDISVFIGFRGSDKFGNIFTSANEVPKTYRALSFSFGAVQFYDKARDVLPF